MGVSTRRHTVIALAAVLVLGVSACDWQGPNSLPLPGTAGVGPGSYSIRIQMPNVTSVQQNSRVRVGDVTVGNVAKVELEGWHALVTVSLDPGVVLPANATAKVGQTSLLGSLHIELAPPLAEAPAGTLQDGDTIPIERASTYPTTEQTLASVSTVLNGGGLAQIQSIGRELDSALNGNEGEVRDLLTQADTFSTRLNDQRTDIVTAMEGLDRLAATVDAQSGVLSSALERIPPALDVLNREKDNATNAIVSLGNFADVADRAVSASAGDIAANLRDLRPALRALGDSGGDLTQSLGLLPTYPWPLGNIPKFFKGDAGNLSGTIDLTLGRLDRGLLQGTPFEGALTDAETALGRTQGRIPPVSTSNPLTAPLDSVVLRGTR